MFITPTVGRTFQTPEFRSCLSKVIRFQKTATPGDIFEFYDGAAKEKCQLERLKYEKRGYRKRKIILSSDYETLLRTAYGTAEALLVPGTTVDKEMCQAVAWVIYNRYYLNPPEMGGGYRSLADVCKKNNDFKNFVGDRAAMGDIEDWLPRNIFNISTKDPTKGATHYFKITQGNTPLPKDSEGTVTIGDCQFYKYRSQNN